MQTGKTNLKLAAIHLLLGLLICAGLPQRFQAQETPARVQQSSANTNSQSPSGGLTNDDVLRLVKAGLGEEMIILKIKQSQTNFDTSPETLIKLKEAGVSDAVLKALLNSGASAGGQRSRAWNISGRKRPAHPA